MPNIVDLSGVSSSTGQQEATKSTSNGIWSYLSALIAGEVNPGSATNGYMREYSHYNVVCLDGTSAVPIGTGSASDTMLLGVFIMKDPGPGIVTIAGFGKATDTNGAYTAKNLVIQGSTSLDTSWFPPGGLINTVGAMTATCSVDEVAWVFWRPL